MANPIWNLRAVPDTAANHVFNNTLLEYGQFGVESDTGRFKLGDGMTRWNSLGFLSAGNIASIWFGSSTEAGNLLEHSTTDGGLTLKPSKLAAAATLAEGLAGTLTFNNIEALRQASPHLGAAGTTGVILRNMLTAMGTDFAGLGSTAHTGKTLQERIKEVSDMISGGQLDFTQILKDDLTVTDKTWSSSKISSTISSLVNTAISNLVGAAPEALNTIYELADALVSNQGLVNTISQELGNCVKFSVQSLSPEQKTQARANISAASTTDLGDVSEQGGQTLLQYFNTIFSSGVSTNTPRVLPPFN